MLPHAPALRIAAAVLLVLTGLFAVLQSWTGWVAAERAVRRSAPLPGVRPQLLVAGCTAVAGALLLVGLLL